MHTKSAAQTHACGNICTLTQPKVGLPKAHAVENVAHCLSFMINHNYEMCPLGRSVATWHMGDFLHLREAVEDRKQPTNAKESWCPLKACDGAVVSIFNGLLQVACLWVQKINLLATCSCYQSAAAPSHHCVEASTSYLHTWNSSISNCTC